MIDRRAFFKISVIGGAAVALVPLIQAFDNTHAENDRWIPESIADLDVQFDATQLSQLTVACDDFRRPDSTTLGISSSGHTWTQTGALSLSRNGVAMTTGSSATAFLPAGRRTQASIEVTVRLGHGDANVCVAVEGAGSSRMEFIFKRTTIENRLVTHGSRVASPRRLISRSRLNLGTTNTIRIDIRPQRFEVFTNGRKVMSDEVATNWDIQGYGFGFRDGDVNSAVHGFIVRDLAEIRLVHGSRVAVMPQLAQPSRYLQASQAVESKRPRYLTDGPQPALYYNGKSTCLVSNVPADSRSFTLFAVVKRDHSAGGTIVGANEALGGFQLRVKKDGSVEALNAGQGLIAHSGRGVIGESASIIALSLDSVANAQIYVNGRPVASVGSTVTFPQGATMSLGATCGGEHFAGSIFEILRWSRPLTGAELRAVFVALAQKWSIDLKQTVMAKTPAPLTAVGIKGSNIIPSSEDLTDEPGSSAWFNFWSRWDWAWIERSVRRGAEQGANTIRLIGDVNAVQTGTISESTYHDRLEQVVRLCADNQCKFYYCGIDLRHKGNSSPEFIAQFLGGVASVLARNENVLAIDLCNEVASAYLLDSEPEVIRWITMWSDAIRRNAPHIPLSISDIAGGGLMDKIAAARYYDVYANVVDFFDVHVYGDLNLADDSKILAPYEMYVNRPLLIGEFGAGRKNPPPDPRAYYAQVRRLRDSSPSIAGVLQWGAVDDDFGLYSESGDQLQTDIAPEWARF